MSEVEVARIIKPHGLKGDVGVLMHNDQSDLLEHVTAVSATAPDGSKLVLQIELAVRMGRGYRVKFLGCDDRTGAEQLRGMRLSVARENLPELSGEESYLIDLIGAHVIGPDGADVGEVIGVQNYPSVDALLVRLPDGTTVEQPWVEDWVERVDRVNRLIVLSSLDALL